MSAWVSRVVVVVVSVVGVLVGAGFSGCHSGEPPETRIYATAFNDSLLQYKSATRAGLDLEKPGAGHGAISHVSLFTRYKHVAYLPIEVEPLLDGTEAAAKYVHGKTASRDADTSRFAQILESLITSQAKLRRNGVESRYATDGENVFSGKLILFHYN